MSYGLVDDIVNQRFAFPPRRKPAEPEGLVDKVQRERFFNSPRPVIRNDDDPPPLMTTEELAKHERALRLKIDTKKQKETTAHAALSEYYRKEREKQKLTAESRKIYQAQYYAKKAANPKLSADNARKYRQRKMSMKVDDTATVQERDKGTRVEMGAK
jgi:hypothetical protein